MTLKEHLSVYKADAASLKRLSKSLKDGAVDFWWNLRSKLGLPRWLSNTCKDERSYAFVFGMAIEAAGLAVQNVFGVQTYPILDMFTGAAFALILYWYSTKR
jgi:hypothetical protein